MIFSSNYTVIACRFRIWEAYGKRVAALLSLAKAASESRRAVDSSETIRLFLTAGAERG
jgi:hypothetical protein